MKNIASALVKAKKEFDPAIKNATNPHFRNRYADLAACLEAVDGALLAHGIFMYQETHDDSSGVTIETVFLHDSGESIRCGKLHVPASKNDPQGYGSALSYARRYSLMAACGIAPEDDDGNAAAQATQKAAQRAVASAFDAQLVAAANQGSEALKAVWQSLTVDARKAVGAQRMSELKQVASQVDKPLVDKLLEASDLDMLYTLGNSVPDLTTEELAALELRQAQLKG